MPVTGCSSGGCCLPSGSQETVQTAYMEGAFLLSASCLLLAAQHRLRQKAFGLSCFLLSEPHLDRNSTWHSFGVETAGPSEVNFPLSPRYCTDRTGVVWLWFLLSVNPVDMRVGLFLDPPLSFLVTVCSPSPACFHSASYIPASRWRCKLESVER